MRKRFRICWLWRGSCYETGQKRRISGYPDIPDPVQKSRESVRREIEQHLDEQIGEYLMEGMEPEEAEKEAVKQMGDPVETGISLDRIHRPRMPWGCFCGLEF